MGNSVQAWLRRLVTDSPTSERGTGVEPNRKPITKMEEAVIPAEIEQLRGQLRAMPKVHPPARLSLRLRILASKEQSRALRFRDWPATWGFLRNRVALHLENMMKPVALPAFGGVLTALFLFLMLSPVYPIRTVSAASLDVPTRLSTSASVKTMASFTAVEKPVMLLVFVNNEGRVVGYRIEEGRDETLDNADARRRIEQILLFTVFTPATSFGMPTSDQVRISVGSNVVLVHG